VKVESGAIYGPGNPGFVMAYKLLGKEKRKGLESHTWYEDSGRTTPRSVLCIMQSTTPICYKIALIRQSYDVFKCSSRLQLLSPGVWLIATFPATAPLAIINLYCLMCVNGLPRDVTS